MKKLIKPSEYVLLGIGGLIDIVSTIRDPVNLLENYYQNMYGYVPDKYKKNMYHTMWRMLTTGNISKEVINGEPKFVITTKGKEKLKREFPLLSMRNSQWDGNWRIVMFDISEKDKSVREMFRSKLYFLGFGQLQKSIWITPYDFLQDFKEFVESVHLEDKVVLIETKTLITENIKEFVYKIWKLELLEKKYRNIYSDISHFLKKYKNIKNKVKKDLTKTSDRVLLLNRIQDRILLTFFIDPWLPKEFYPDNWIGDIVYQTAKQNKLIG